MVVLVSVRSFIVLIPWFPVAGSRDPSRQKTDDEVAIDGP